MRPILVFLSFLFISPVFSEQKVDPLLFFDAESLGYRDAKLTSYSESVCLQGFSPAEVRVRGIRATKLMSEERGGVYCRFSLIAEEYETPTKALERLAFIDTKKFANSLESKSCYFRRAFVVQNILYQVHTDVPYFESELNRLTPLFKKHFDVK